MSYLDGKRVILGVTGCIAAYKSAEIVRTLQKKGALVRVVMTASATKFIHPITLQTLSGREVLSDQFQWTGGISHIDLAQMADLIIIAPATANTLAKLAVGIADNLLTSTILASRSKIMIAPAMNEGMYLNPATQRNIQSLKERSVFMVGPDYGELACGDIGPGRMCSVEEIIFSAEMLVAPNDFKDKRVLVTAGATREYVDSVRFITNRSSGKMGLSIAKEARRRGATVDLVQTNSTHPKIPGVETHYVVSSDQMSSKLKELFPSCDILMMTAAVSDFQTGIIETGKKKRKMGKLNLELTLTQDILADIVTQKRPDQLVVGFAAEFGDPLPKAQEKMREKGSDLMVCNDISRDDIGFESDDNEVYILGRGEPVFISKRSKDEIAKAILDSITEKLKSMS